METLVLVIAGSSREEVLDRLKEFALDKLMFGEPSAIGQAGAVDYDYEWSPDGEKCIADVLDWRAPADKERQILKLAADAEDEGEEDLMYLLNAVAFGMDRGCVRELNDAVKGIVLDKMNRTIRLGMKVRP